MLVNWPQLELQPLLDENHSDDTPKGSKRLFKKLFLPSYQSYQSWARFPEMGFNLTREDCDRDVTPKDKCNVFHMSVTCSL